MLDKFELNVCKKRRRVFEHLMLSICWCLRRGIWDPFLRFEKGILLWFRAISAVSAVLLIAHWNKALWCWCRTTLWHFKYGLLLHRNSMKRGAFIVIQAVVNGSSWRPCKWTILTTCLWYLPSLRIFFSPKNTILFFSDTRLANRKNIRLALLFLNKFLQKYWNRGPEFLKTWPHASCQNLSCCVYRLVPSSLKLGICFRRSCIALHNWCWKIWLAIACLQIGRMAPIQMQNKNLQSKVCTIIKTKQGVLTNCWIAVFGIHNCNALHWCNRCSKILLTIRWGARYKTDIGKQEHYGINATQGNSEHKRAH